MPAPHATLLTIGVTDSHFMKDREFYASPNPVGIHKGFIEVTNHEGGKVFVRTSAISVIMDWTTEDREIIGSQIVVGQMIVQNFNAVEQITAVLIAGVCDE